VTVAVSPLQDIGLLQTAGQHALVPHMGKAFVFGGTDGGTEGLAAVQELHPGRLEGCGYREDFEHGGSLGPLSWSGSFSISQLSAYSGAYALWSNHPGHNASTQVSLAVSTGAGPFCFWWRGQSESSYDWFTFVADATISLQVSGDHLGWTRHCVTVAAGSHTFRWTYSKDGSASVGEDQYFVDDVALPAESDAFCAE